MVSSCLELITSVEYVYSTLPGTLPRGVYSTVVDFRFYGNLREVPSSKGEGEGRRGGL